MVTKYGKIGYPVDKIITESIIIDNDRNSKNKMIKIMVTENYDAENYDH